jgi:hypothetical protein
MHLYSRSAVGFAVSVVVITLCCLGARAEWARPPHTTRQLVARLDGSESERAYQFCLRHIADGCEP